MSSGLYRGKVMVAMAGALRGLNGSTEGTGARPRLESAEPRPCAPADLSEAASSPGGGARRVPARLWPIGGRAVAVGVAWHAPPAAAVGREGKGGAASIASREGRLSRPLE